MVFERRHRGLHLGLVEVFTWDLDLSEVGGEVRWDDPVDDSCSDDSDDIGGGFSRKLGQWS